MHHRLHLLRKTEESESKPSMPRTSKYSGSSLAERTLLLSVLAILLTVPSCIKLTSKNVLDSDETDVDHVEVFGSNNKVYDSIIIGAGWAGLRAAKTLLDEGVTNILILEANDYIGGRSKSVNQSKCGGLLFM